ncbi:hypothetical protein [Fundidesulfovibrio terrae]|uniref:hypothetical protein n=1 Tax=Fundidesulfovibrio terrae TaxID=2922866 RepID=UPI001FB01847|nr:hypothetical protein [Fundidesulfovibrio terrae]
MRTLTALIICLTLTACAGVPLMPGGDSEDSLTAADASFTLKLPAGWTVKQKGGGEGGRVSILAHKDAAATGKGYPTMVIRQVLDPTPQGVLDIMTKDTKLDFSELWTVSPEKYQLKQALLDETSRVLSYWVVPRDGQDLEYYGCIILTGYGRVEMIGVAQAGTTAKYMKDFNQMFTSLNIAEKARFNPAQSGDTAAYLRKTYASALEREKNGLTRLAAETASWAGAAAGLTAQEKGFIGTTYVKAVNKALEACAGLTEVIGRAQANDSRAEMQRFAERLEEAATAVDTVQLNIRENQVRTSVEKSAARIKRMAALGREASKMPL